MSEIEHIKAFLERVGEDVEAGIILPAEDQKRIYGYAVLADGHEQKLLNEYMDICESLSRKLEEARMRIAELEDKLSDAVAKEREACAQLLDARKRECEEFAANPEGDEDTTEYLNDAATYRGAAHEIRNRGK